MRRHRRPFALLPTFVISVSPLNLPIVIAAEKTCITKTDQFLWQNVNFLLNNSAPIRYTQPSAINVIIQIKEIPRIASEGNFKSRSWMKNICIGNKVISYWRARRSIIHKQTITICQRDGTWNSKTLEQQVRHLCHPPKLIHTMDRYSSIFVRIFFSRIFTVALADTHHLEKLIRPKQYKQIQSMSLLIELISAIMIMQMVWITGIHPFTPQALTE